MRGFWCITWLLFSGVTTAFGAEPPKLDPARAATVRQMYSKMPATLLELTEPVAIVDTDFFRDTFTTVIVLEDAKDRQLVVRYHKELRGDKVGEVGLSAEKRSKEKRELPARGAEEAAVYGVLARWREGVRVAREEEGPARWRIPAVDELLRDLDRRYGEDLPLKTP